VNNRTSGAVKLNSDKKLSLKKSVSDICTFVRRNIFLLKFCTKQFWGTSEDGVGTHNSSPLDHFPLEFLGSSLKFNASYKNRQMPHRRLCTITDCIGYVSHKSLVFSGRNAGRPIRKSAQQHDGPILYRRSLAAVSLVLTPICRNEHIIYHVCSPQRKVAA